MPVRWTRSSNRFLLVKLWAEVAEEIISNLAQLTATVDRTGK